MTAWLQVADGVVNTAYVTRIFIGCEPLHNTWIALATVINPGTGYTQDYQISPEEPGFATREEALEAIDQLLRNLE